ncbi:MAG: hypothetical protein ACRDRT_12105 [Pseudonocardiaceae bacterium]
MDNWTQGGITKTGGDRTSGIDQGTSDCIEQTGRLGSDTKGG